MTAAALPDGTMAGYRLVRRLGSGSRADVYLATGSTGAVVLKVFRAETDKVSIGHELDALGRIESPHLPHLIDVASDPDGTPIMILERIAQGTVAALLAARKSIECGEAITLLAPIAALVGDLADAGVAHSRIELASLRIGGEGQPVLVGFGHCHLFEAGGTMAAIDAEPAAAEDRDALAALAVEILSRVRDDGQSDRVGDLVRWIEETPRAYEFPRELAERLFACAEPLPLALAPAHPVVDPPSRRSPERPPVPEPAEEPRQLPTWLAELLHDNPATVLRKRLSSLARGVRPRFWIIAAAAVLGLVIASTLIPSGGAPTTEAIRSTAVPHPPRPTRTPVALPDDPLDASRVLLRTRSTCLHDLSILCLDGVDEPSSSAFTIDAASIQRVQQGGELPGTALPAGTELVLTERLGDTALIGLGAVETAPKDGPQSILVIRTKAGWRIRDYLTGAQATPSP